MKTTRTTNLKGRVLLTSTVIISFFTSIVLAQAPSGIVDPSLRYMATVKVPLSFAPGVDKTFLFSGGKGSIKGEFFGRAELLSAIVASSQETSASGESYTSLRNITPVLIKLILEIPSDSVGRNSTIMLELNNNMKVNTLELTKFFSGEKGIPFGTENNFDVSFVRVYPDLKNMPLRSKNIIAISVDERLSSTKDGIILWTFELYELTGLF